MYFKLKMVGRKVKNKGRKVKIRAESSELWAESGIIWAEKNDVCYNYHRLIQYLYIILISSSHDRPNMVYPAKPEIAGDSHFC